MGSAKSILDINRIDPSLEPIFQSIGEILLEKNFETRLFLACILARGNLLIEDLPGMGKTTLARAFSQVLGLKMGRIQLTNDVLPADILGSHMFDSNTREFKFLEGPIFTEILLADELNRASPKSQSALLEAMEERRVTVDGKTFSLPNCFFLVATQNPEQQVGTNPLPESQLDRFMMRIQMGYPTAQAERQMLRSSQRGAQLEVTPLLNEIKLRDLQNRVAAIHVSEAIVDYIHAILNLSREQNHSLSPRAGLMLRDAAKAWATIGGREFVLPEDVQAVAPSCLNHRLANTTQQNPWELIREMVELIRAPI